ncbi:MAG TPA: phenylalanine--tRNA ligase subunit alpha [Acidimicrobiales bacterium]|nr:phenylalanine--tRNA ligase subunit alpha [Acidimicrobiales bacterium]
MTLTDEITRAGEKAVAIIAEAASLDELKAAEPTIFGKKSALGSFKKSLGGLDPDERRQVGRHLNAVRDEVGEALARRREQLAAVERRRLLEAERLDLTEVPTSPRLGHAHLVSQAQERLEDVFVGMGFTVAEGPEAETDWYNFEALNIPRWHPARSMWDTLYLDLGDGDNVVLRTHTSPVQIRVMQNQGPPIYSVMPGRVYRRDTADASHMPVFHQIEGLVVDRGITFGDLAGTLDAFTAAYFGESISSRLRPSYFPFTEPSAEFDITCVICGGEGCQTCQRTGWIELGGCGMVHPNVLRNVDIDPEEYSGFAFGFGIDRLALMRHGVEDLRQMFTNDVRFLSQF